MRWTWVMNESRGATQSWLAAESRARCETQDRTRQAVRGRDLQRLQRARAPACCSQPAPVQCFLLVS
eukprot:950608-Rhodomonas_salina.1